MNGQGEITKGTGKMSVEITGLGGMLYSLRVGGCGYDGLKFTKADLRAKFKWFELAGWSIDEKLRRWLK